MNGKGSRFPSLPDTYLLSPVQAVTVLSHFPSLSQLQLIPSRPLFHCSGHPTPGLRAWPGKKLLLAKVCLHYLRPLLVCLIVLGQSLGTCNNPASP